MTALVQAQKDVLPFHHLPELPAPGFLGHIRMLRGNQLRMIEAARQHGDVVRSRIGIKRLVLVSDPETIQHILVNNASNYLKATRGYFKMQLMMGTGLVTSDGDFWRRQRRIAQPAFARRRVSGFADTMVRATLDMLEQWARHPGNTPLDVAEAMMRVTLRIAGETLFSRDLTGDAAADVADAVDILMRDFQRLVSAPYPWPERLPPRRNRAFFGAIRTIDTLVWALIAERRTGGPDAARDDLLQMLLEAQDAETGEGMTDAQLRDEVVTMLLAGHETTANALAWALHLLGEHPEEQERVAEEVAAVLGDRPPTVEDLVNLPTVERAVKESMRLFPPVWAIGRVPKADDVLAGCRVPAGSYVFISQWGTHRNPRLWTEPDRFLPARWKDDAPPEPHGGHRLAYFPFAAGQRKCIGDHFARLEAALLLTCIMQRFRLTPVPGRHPKPNPSITLRPLGGVWATLQRR